MEINDEVKTRLIKYLDSVEELVNKGIDLASDQLPVIAHELIAWNRASTTIGLLFSIGIVVTGFLAMRKCFKLAQTTEPYVVGCLAGALFSLAGFITTLCNAMPCIKAWFAPRLVLLETLRDFASH